MADISNADAETQNDNQLPNDSDDDNTDNVQNEVDWCSMDYWGKKFFDAARD